MGTITGSNGSDTITGTSGSDIINSGNGDDVVNGGGGSDQVNGGAGNDTLIYNVSENLGGSKDVYTGGAGVDTVRILLTFDQWTDSTVRLELEKYVKFLSTVKANPQGEVSNGSASDFVFTFGTSTLTVQMMEKLAVWVQPQTGGDYVQVDYLTSLITGNAAGMAVEAGGVGNSNAGTPIVSGVLYSDDLNGADNLFQAVNPGAAANYGSYSVTSNGVWKYTLNNADSRVQELRENETLSDTITVRTADGAVKVVNITIMGSNDAPVVSAALSSTAAEGSGPYTMNLLAGASDADHGETGTLSVDGVGYSVDGGVVSSTAPAGVSLTGNTLSVDPSNGFFNQLAVGEHSTIVVSYMVKDAKGATVAQSATITIDGTNDVPVVSAALSSVKAEGSGPYAMNLLAGASDADHGETATLSVDSVSYSVDGVAVVGIPQGVSLAGHTLSVDSSHNAFNSLSVGEHTTVVVSYNIRDAQGATVAQSATITITGTNDAPVVSAALTSVKAEGSVSYTMNLLAGASDVDHGETANLSVDGVSYSVDGVAVVGVPPGVSLADNMLSVNPAHSAFDHLAVGEHATIVVNYNVKDAQGATVAQSATLTINGTNDVPVVSAALSSTAAEGTGSYTMNLLGGASDADDGETATLSVANVGYSVDGGGTFGTVPAGVSLVGSTLSVDPSNTAFNHLAVGAHATIVVSYNIKDAQGATVAQSATITINGTNDAPVVSGVLSSEKDEGDGSYDMNLLAGASDVDNGETATLNVVDVTYSLDGGVASSSAPAGVSLAGNMLSVNPAHGAFDHLAVGEHVTIMVSYNVKDAQGAIVAQSATITINGTNDVPVVSGVLSSEKDEGDGSHDMDLLAGASDVDNGETTTLSVADVTYSVDGGPGSSSAPAGLSLAGNTLSVNPAHGVFDHLAVGEHATIVVSYNVKDAQDATVAQSATITINGTNDAPVVSGVLSSERDEGDSSYDMNLLAGASDVDNGETATLSVADVSYSLDGGPGSGSAPAGVSLAGNTLSVNPAHSAFDHLAVGEYSTIVVSYNVKDAQGATVAQSATITINGTNDAPVVSGVLSSEKDEGDSSYEMDLLAGASDVDKGETTTLSVADVTYSVDGGPGSSSASAGVSLVGNMLSVNPAHSAFDHLAVGEKAIVVVSYNVKDAQGATVAQSATITINGTNDVPVVSGVLSSEKDEGDGSYDMNLLAGASDVDNGETATLSVADVTYSVDGVAAAGNPPSVSLAGNTLSVNPAHSAFDHLAVGEHATIVVSYNVKDAQGATVAQSATITINGTNDVPVVSGVLTSEKDEGDSSYDMNLLAGASDVDNGETATLSVADVTYSVDGGPGSSSAPAGVSLAGNMLSVNPAHGAFDHLAVGEHATIVVSYNVKDAQGATVAQSATITITGTNDVPVVSGVLTSEKDEGDGAYDMNLLAGASDVDDGETVTLSVADVTYSLDGGAASSSAPEGVNLAGNMLSVNSAHGAFDHLAVGEQSTIVVSYNVKDAQGATVAQSATITINGTNDAPVVSGVLTSVKDEGDGSYDMNLLAGASDVDNGETTTLSVADVASSVDGGPGSSSAPAGVSLAGNTLSVNPVHGAFDHLAVGEHATIVVSYNVKDAQGATVAQSATITINGTNDTPVVSGVLSSEEDEGDGSYYMDLLAGASDVDNGETATLSVADVIYSVDGGPDSGSAPAGVSLAGNMLSVNPVHGAFDHLAVGEQATIVVSYNVKDAQGATVAQSATITINGTNDMPVVSGVLSSEKEEGDSSYGLNLLAGASDVDNGETTTLSVADVTYSVDGGPGSSSAPAGVSLAGNMLSVNPAHGAFDHLAVGEHATIVVSYNVKDAQGATVVQSATITINGTNDVPVVSAALSSTAAEGAGSYTMNLLGGASDADDGETATLSVANVGYSVDGGAVSGTAPAGVSLVGSTLSVDPSNTAFNHLAVGAHATVVVSYNVKDAQGATVAQSATITISGTNDVPVVSAALSSTAAEGAGSYTMNLLGGASDADDGETATLSVANVGYSVDGGAVSATAPAGVSLVGSTLSVDPSNTAFNHLAAGAHATVVVSYNVKDAQGATVAQSATITINGTNDVPVVSAALTSTAAEGAGSYAMNLLSGASDADDGETATLSVANVGYSVDGGAVSSTTPAGVSLAGSTLTVNPANGAFDHLAVGENSTIVVSYNVKDAQGATVAQSATITITGTNDAPVLNAAASPVLTDVIEDAGAPAGAVGTLVSSLVNLNPPVGGLDNVTDADNGALTGIALIGTNSTSGSWWYSTNGGTNWTAVGTVSNSAALLLSADANTRLYFQGNTDFNGTVSDGVTFRAWDRTSGAAGTKVSTTSNGGSSAFSTATDTAAITVVDDNYAPVATADRVIVSSGTTVTISTSALLGNDTDIDGAALTITSVGTASGITNLALTGTGITFKSGNTAGNSVGSFQYTVSDGRGGTATGTVAIDVKAVSSNSSNGDTVDLSGAGTYQASYIDADNGPDTVTGGGAGDNFYGGSGNAVDVLKGSAGNDLLVGEGGNDDLSGGAGNDILRGGSGDDVMDGGDGSEDMLDLSDGNALANFTLIQSSSANSTGNAGGLGIDSYKNMEGVIGSSSNDSINGSAGNDIIRGGGGNDTLDGKGGNDLLDFSDGTAGITFTMGLNGAGSFSAAGLGTDTYTGFEGVIGTAFADTLTGSAAADELRGGAGNDTISGLAGDDRIVGGAGSDTLTGGADNDTFVFDTAPNAVDSIMDFNASGSLANGDMIELSLAVFAGITTPAGSVLSSSEFATSAGGGVTDVLAAGVRVIYDTVTGNLYYDSDGQGSGGRTLVAKVVLDNPADTFDYNDIKLGS
ncbi:beta strand repeat-containing protein [Massilia eburnea]|uniref:beta strand repeat-containing protein n=1 Tax=Massilia eburnea TaxID=1776165 RepID=UPI003D6A5CE0